MAMSTVLVFCSIVAMLCVVTSAPADQRLAIKKTRLHLGKAQKTQATDDFIDLLEALLQRLKEEKADKGQRSLDRPSPDVTLNTVGDVTGDEVLSRLHELASRVKADHFLVRRQFKGEVTADNGGVGASGSYDFDNGLSLGGSYSTDLKGNSMGTGGFSYDSDSGLNLGGSYSTDFRGNSALSGSLGYKSDSGLGVSGSYTQDSFGNSGWKAGVNYDFDNGNGNANFGLDSTGNVGLGFSWRF